MERKDGECAKEGAKQVVFMRRVGKSDAMPERATLNSSGVEPLKGEARLPSDRILIISLTTLLQQSRYSAAPLYLYPF
jgi:hypothetical protein